MKDCYLVAKLRAQTAREYRRQRDLGYEHHRGTAKIQRRAHGPHIHFGFSASGYAVKQECCIDFPGQWLFDFPENGDLRVSKFMRCRLQNARRGQGISAN